MDLITHKSGAQDKVFGFGYTTILGANEPTATFCVELGTNNDSVERTVLLDIEDFINMVEICSELCIVGVVCGPVPVLPHLRETELVLGNFGVNSCSWITVPSPCTLCMISDADTTFR